MARLRWEVSLKDLGIEGRVNIRSAATGAKIIEVSGEGHADKADLLAGTFATSQKSVGTIMGKRTCVLEHCRNTMSKEISLHQFPINTNILSQWLKAMNMKKVPGQSWICSDHFAKSDFFPRRNGRRNILHFNAVPSRNMKSLLRVPSLGDFQAQRRNERRAQRARSLEDMRSGDCKMDIDTRADQLVKASTSEPSIDAAVKTYDSSFFDVPLTSNYACIEGSENSSREAEQIGRDENVDKAIQESKQQWDTYVVPGKCSDVCSGDTLDCEDIDGHTVIVESIQELKDVGTATDNYEFFVNTGIAVIDSIKFGQLRRVCSRYFFETLDSLYHVLKSGIYWPTKDEILSTLPACFSSFAKTRIVLDCTEVPIEKPKCLRCRIRCYSHYKGRETVKIQIGVTPSGLVSHLSDVFGGRASDKAIFNSTDILENLTPYVDAIMVDKGFLIEAECAQRGIDLIRPPFLAKQKQFTTSDVCHTKKIAAARIHVERAIQRIKLFQIMSGPVSWRLVPHFGEIVTVITAIVNLSPPIIGEQGFREIKTEN
ncbi:PREDICTED: uncharacterized protein LOC105557402 [Vollenhovia emeryi]|uniref:uncharacterized protein LOC105557402 n=1 Tax=Vollenhovia emeryi TaxID=411798 RepID=UPI0005F387A3|nr:PREDICTED: uncharacterized protein LOC105557402 [Vollenhovia emeryi]